MQPFASKTKENVLKKLGRLFRYLYFGPYGGRKLGEFLIFLNLLWDSVKLYIGNGSFLVLDFWVRKALYRVHLLVFMFSGSFFWVFWLLVYFMYTFFYH